MIKFATSFARSGFGLGVAIGLMVTIHLHSFVQAMPMRTATDPPPAPKDASTTPVPEWGEPEYVQANSGVYEQLFWGPPWDGNSTMAVTDRVLREGRNDGVNDRGDPFVLQAMAVVQLAPDEAAVSLTQEQYDQWISGNVQVSFFAGLLIVGQYWIPVSGFSYSSDVNPRAQIVVVEEYDDTLGDSFINLWAYKSQLPPGMFDDLDEDWSFWLCDQVWPMPDPDCEKTIAQCMDEFQSNIRLAIAAYKATWATVGLSCVVGGVLIGSFCLVGNLLACGVWGWMSWRCGILLGAATAALVTALLAARIALDDCLGDCSLGSIGCP